MKKEGLRIIKRLHVFVMLILTFTLLTANVASVRAQELPKSWMPKWKVGDWWRVIEFKNIGKFTIGRDAWVGPYRIKYEVVDITQIGGEEAFVVEVKNLDKRSGTKYDECKYISYFSKKNFRARRIEKKCPGEKARIEDNPQYLQNEGISSNLYFMLPVFSFEFPLDGSTLEKDINKSESKKQKMRVYDKKNWTSLIFSGGSGAAEMPKVLDEKGSKVNIREYVSLHSKILSSMESPLYYFEFQNKGSHVFFEFWNHKLPWYLYASKKDEVIFILENFSGLEGK